MILEQLRKQHALQMNENDETKPSQFAYIPENAVRDILGHQRTHKTSHQTNEQGEGRCKLYTFIRYQKKILKGSKQSSKYILDQTFIDTNI
ncbi:MAG: hypothetical protein EZS28_032683 [Streblomastix strix]|uniref:Uncharacterized protein n=1 Tax=Streblomastix strix TaxID=222440 RepID=A0A5J4UP79_9EUKA|nr:MAG: hypothetical protein EZS28_032683 [Streblomastix strix]